MIRDVKKLLGDFYKNCHLKFALQEYEILKTIDLTDEYKKKFNEKKLRDRNDKLSIVFIIPGMSKNSGGHTSILRLGTYLAEFGHKIHYVSYLPQSISEMRENANYNLKGYSGEIFGSKKLEEFEYDIGIATYWLSAYYLWNMENVKYKAYFIQDFEPDFYPSGDIRTFVENTYLMDYHMISLGAWNKQRIENRYRVHVDSILFPFEPKEYWLETNWKDKFSRKDKIKIATYLKNDSKRGPIFLIMGLNELYKKAKEEGYEVEIVVFGSPKQVKYPLKVPHINLGQPPKNKLRELYQKSDFGVVFSYTNISLVPLEMMASGCPVVEVYEGSFSRYFNPHCAILVRSYPKDLTKKVMWHIEHPEERIKIIETAINDLKNRTWREAACQFNEILVKGYNRERGN